MNHGPYALKKSGFSLAGACQLIYPYCRKRRTERRLHSTYCRPPAAPDCVRPVPGWRAVGCANRRLRLRGIRYGLQRPGIVSPAPATPCQPQPGPAAARDPRQDAAPLSAAWSGRAASAAAAEQIVALARGLLTRSARGGANSRHCPPFPSAVGRGVGRFIARRSTVHAAGCRHWRIGCTGAFSSAAHPRG